MPYPRVRSSKTYDSNLTEVLVSGGSRVLERSLLAHQKLEAHHALEIGVSHIGKLIPLRSVQGSSVQAPRRGETWSARHGAQKKLTTLLVKPVPTSTLPRWSISAADVGVPPARALTRYDRQ